APRAESAEPLRQPAHGAAHAGFDDETVETGLTLGLQEQGQGQGIISIEHGGSAGGRFSQQRRKFSGAERGCPRALDLIRLDDLDRSCGQGLNRRRPDVVWPWRPCARTSAHCFSFGAATWRVAKPMAKSSREMGVVAEAAGVRDLAERLACLQRGAAMQKARGMIQTKRVNEFAA